LRVFLDECLGRRLAREILGPEVRTARDQGWTGVANGRLLALVAQSFDVFVTTDRNLSFQQNLQAQPIAVIVLRARANRLADLLPLVPELLRVIPVAPACVATIVGAI
jgi:hypothetical protein